MQDNNHSNPDPAPVPDNHPLREMFHHLVSHAFHDTLGMPQHSVSGYLADLLTDFAHTDSIHRLKNGQGVRLRAVHEMLSETLPDSEEVAGYSFDRERTVHKHIGDFALFWGGIYPEMLRQLRQQGQADHLIDYVKQGKQSYYIVSTFQHGRYAEDAFLFRQLSDEFELCLYGLSLVRREWEQLTARPPVY